MEKKTSTNRWQAHAQAKASAGYKRVSGIWAKYGTDDEAAIKAFARKLSQRRERATSR